MEEDIKIQVCRLCFSLISDKNFFSIKDSLKVMLQVITTDLDLDITDSPVMCHECSKSLQEIFTFKTNCFELEEKITSKITKVKNKKLNLRDIMNNGSKRKSTRAKLKNNKLCRTCLETVEGNAFIYIDKNTDKCLSTIIDSCLSELDLNLTSDPVMCETCYKILLKMRDFKSVCEKNKSQIEAYSRRKYSSFTKKLNLHNILQFLSDLGTKSEISGSVVIKTEPAEGAGEVKTDENIDLGEEHYEPKDYPEYVTVKMEPVNEIGIQQVKREVKEELPIIESCLEYVTVKMEPEIGTQVEREVEEEISRVENCLEYVTVKMESTNDEEGIDQDQIEEGTNDADLEDNLLNTKKPNPDKLKSENKSSNPRSQTRRFSKRLKQIKASEENNMKPCSDCDFKTKHLYSLRCHHVIVHNRKDAVYHKKFENKHCPDCDFQTKYKHLLMRHLVKFHGRKEFMYQKKLFRCDKCSFASKFNIELTRHMLSHIKPEALQCSRCAFSTNQNSLFIKHILSHVTTENMDKYSCLQLLKKAQ